MPAYATCTFPLVDAWKDLGDKNPLVAAIDSVLSGYGQIVLSDNSATGLLFIAAIFTSSFSMGVSTLVCTITALLFAMLIGVPPILLRLGLYTFCPALTGLGIAGLIFPGQDVSIAMLAMDAAGGILCVLLSSAFSSFFGKWGISGFSLPFCLVLAFFLPAALTFTAMETSIFTIPYMNTLANPAVAGTWSMTEFAQAVVHGFAECIFQADTLSGVLVLTGIIMSSRIDLCTAICGVIAATLTAILLGLPKDSIMLGLYGYNAVFTMLALFGRGFAMSRASFAFAMVAAVLSVFIFSAFSALFAPLGVPVTALPFVFIALTAFIGREAFTRLQFVDLIHWGVPETIAAMLKQQKAETEEPTPSH